MVTRDGEENQWSAFYLNKAEEVIDQKKTTSSPMRCFASRNSQGDWEIKPEIFNREGVALLEKDYRTRDIIIMDELGRFEIQAYPFQKKVEEILTGPKIVLGVIKEERNSFLDRIRERRDMEIFTVSKDNREEIYQEVYNWIREILWK